MIKEIFTYNVKFKNFFFLEKSLNNLKILIMKTPYFINKLYIKNFFFKFKKFIILKNSLKKKYFKKLIIKFK